MSIVAELGTAGAYIFVGRAAKTRQTIIAEVLINRILLISYHPLSSRRRAHWYFRKRSYSFLLCIIAPHLGAFSSFNFPLKGVVNIIMDSILLDSILEKYRGCA
jgi:hypothetical protein